MDYVITRDINKATHWIAREDGNNCMSNVTVDVIYAIEYDELKEEYFVVDDKGYRSLIFLAHNGDFVYFE